MEKSNIRCGNGVKNGSKFGINIFFSRSTSMEMEIKKFLPQIQILYHQVLFLTNHLRCKGSADIKILTLRGVSKLMALLSNRGHDSSAYIFFSQ